MIHFGHDAVVSFVPVNVGGGLLVVSPGGGSTGLNRLEIEALGTGIVRVFVAG